ncbi:putative holin-like toxin [Metabacillus lacus]
MYQLLNVMFGFGMLLIAVLSFEDKKK